jgi:RNA polymerase sigma factor (sigma-70 family)
MRVDVAAPQNWPDDLSDSYRRNRARLLKAAYLICMSRTSAEDAVQETFSRVADRWDRLEIRNLDAYLYSCVVNAARDGVAYGYRVSPFAELEERALLAPDALSASDVDIAVALGRLSVDQRTAIVLRYFDGFTSADIARLLGVRPATVRSWLRRGLSALRPMLEG